MPGLEVAKMFCGWDWGSTQHGVCLIDDDGAVIKTWKVPPTEADLTALFTDLATLGDPPPTRGPYLSDCPETPESPNRDRHRSRLTQGVVRFECRMSS